MKRIESLDLARGFTVLCIAPVHTVLLYSNAEIYTTALGYFLAFIAEGPGAQLFMVLMGMFIAFKPVADMNDVAKRSAVLLLAGYALNIIKFVLPLYLGLIPEAMQQDLMIQNNFSGMAQLFGLGDILQFAAFALIITHKIRERKNYCNTALILASAIVLLSPFFWDAHSNNNTIDYILQLIGGQPPHVFFPLLPWLFYPLLGLVIGDAFKKNREAVYPQLLKWGIGWVLFGLVAHYVAGSHYNTVFYRTYPWDTIGHAGVVLIILWIWEWLNKYIMPNRFFQCLVYYSKSITLVYIIQWILIIWLLPFFGYHELNYIRTIIAIVLTSALTLLISISIDKCKTKNKKP
jgi:hypothetical protein